MYSPRLYKYQDSYSTVYTYNTHLQFGIPYTHSWYRHTYMTFPPPVKSADISIYCM